jgi:hypothetical protein
MRRSLISISRFLLIGAVVTLGAAEGAPAAGAATADPTLSVATTCDAPSAARTITWTITAPTDGVISELDTAPVIAPLNGLKVGDPIGPTPRTVTQTFTDFVPGRLQPQQLRVKVKYLDGTESAEVTGSIEPGAECGDELPPIAWLDSQCDALVRIWVDQPYGRTTTIMVVGQNRAGRVAYQQSMVLPPDGQNRAFWVPADFAQPVTVYADGVPITGGKPATGCAPHAVSKTVQLFAANNTFISAEDWGLFPVVSRGAGSRFEVIGDLPQGYIALRDKQSGKYVTADPGSGEPPAADADSIGAAQLFSTDQTFDPSQPSAYEFTRFRTYLNPTGSADSGYYLGDRPSNPNDPLSPLALVVSRPGAADGRLAEVAVGDADIALKAHANGRYVTAESAGSQPLIARGTAVGDWETYDLIPAYNGQVALFSHANGKFVTAESAGTAPLIARGTGIGAWEKFTVVKQADGSVALKAGANNQYVTAENAGTQPLIARATTVGAWEEFDRTP